MREAELRVCGPYLQSVCVCLYASRPSHLSGQKAEGTNDRAAGEKAEPADAAEHTTG